jgi:hypothetical protein
MDSLESEQIPFRHARESGHPGATNTGIALATLDARFRGHDGFYGGDAFPSGRRQWAASVLPP